MRWSAYGFAVMIPFLVLYSVTLGPLVGELRTRICVTPEWRWYGPIPVHRARKHWVAVT